MPETLTVAPLTGDRLPDLAKLFGASKTTQGCYCMWFIASAKECQAGWAGANRSAFEALTAAEPVPTGLLAYLDGEPVGWCATGPRSRYARALRSPVMKGRDPTENDSVWLVPCFFVRSGFRGMGVMRQLLDHAVQLAAEHGATAVEGFPLSGEKRRGSGEAYLGVEPLFAQRGFTVVDRPTPARVLMRLDLPRGGRTRRPGAARPRGGRRAQGASEE